MSQLVDNNAELDSSASDSESIPPSNVGIALTESEKQVFQDNSSRSIFIRDLPFHFRDETLLLHLESLVQGDDIEIVQCRVQYCAGRGGKVSSKRMKTLQVAYVMLGSEQEAKNLLNKLGGNSTCCGRILRAFEFHRQPKSEHNKIGEVNFTFEATNNEHQITEAVVSEHFQELFGPDTVFSVCIRSHFEKEGGYQNGYGFVSFFSIDKRQEIVNKTFRKDNVKYEFRPIRNNRNIKKSADCEENEKGAVSSVEVCGRSVESFTGTAPRPPYADPNPDNVPGSSYTYPYGYLGIAPSVFFPASHLQLTNRPGYIWISVPTANGINVYEYLNLPPNDAHMGYPHMSR
jgi:hypothetical protein